MVKGPHRWAFGVTAAIAAVGCSDRGGAEEYVPAPIVAAPSRVRQGAPNALPIQGPKPTETAKRPTPQREAEPEGPAVTEYGNQLATILRKKTSAAAAFQHQVEDAAESIDAKGIAALIPPYEQYARSVESAVKAIQKLSPPSSVKGIHKAILTSCSRLEANLQATAGAMRSDAGAKAASLNKDRRQIETAGTQMVQDSFDAAGYDATQFALHGIFVRKG